MSITCVHMDEDLLRTIAEKKCGTPKDTPLEKVLEALAAAGWQIAELIGQK